jgi:hypothetical protein
MKLIEIIKKNIQEGTPYWKKDHNTFLKVVGIGKHPQEQEPVIYLEDGTYLCPDQSELSEFVIVNTLKEME